MRCGTVWRSLIPILMISAEVCAGQSCPYNASLSPPCVNHVVYIIQENRTFDNYFGSFPGVSGQCVLNHALQGISCTVGNNTPCTGGGTCSNVTIGVQSTTNYIDKQLVTVTNPQGQQGNLPDSAWLHSRANSLTAIHAGAMNGWNAGGTCAVGGAACTQSGGTNCSSGANGPCLSSSYYYADSSALNYYWSLANTYGINDQFFSSLTGPTYPNHLMIIAATSNEASDNPSIGWGCGNGGTGTPPSSPYTGPGEIYNGTKFYNVCASGDPNCGPSGDGLAAGTGYSAGSCSASATTACKCFCQSGKYINGAGSANCTSYTDGSTVVSGSCTNDGISATACSSGTCKLSASIGNTPGAACPNVTTIAELAETAGLPHPWKWYGNYASLAASTFVPQLFFRSNYSTVYNVSDAVFNTDAAALTGQCVNTPHAACSLDSDCVTLSQGNQCVDNTASSTFPQIAFLTANVEANTEHASTGFATPLADLQAGQGWVQSKLAAVFANKYLYYHSQIFIVWDDFGGQPDHVAPVSQDALSLGMRSPILSIGPFAKNTVVHGPTSGNPYEFTSIMKCIEKVFNLGRLNNRDLNASDLCAGTGTLASNTDGMLNTSQAPIPPPGTVVGATRFTPGTRVTPGTSMR